MNRRAFTLIELLIVVGIIAILASIAAVNYSHATARSRVATVKNDFRLLAGAVEVYRVDNNAVPPAAGVGIHYNEFGPFTDPVGKRLIPLTTPLAYLSSIPRDPFPPTSEQLESGVLDLYDTYDYVNAGAEPERGSGITSGAEWRIVSAGPDRFMAYGGRPVQDREVNARGVDYDPTNGTFSNGDLVVVGELCTKFGDPLSPSYVQRPGIVRVPAYVEQWQ
ncbi:MAG: type II secretion system protein [Candidatus Sumerlaeaceae bacterium]